MAGYNRDASRRIEKVVRRVERSPRFKVEVPENPRISSTGKYAIVTTAIGAAVRATETIGKGIGTLQIVTYDSSDVATYEAMQTGVPLYSGALAPIAVGRLVMVDVYDGRYHVVVDFC